jgi:hypothetical protein
MRGDRAIGFERLRPNGGRATAKLRRQTRLFELISITFKYLHAILANLSVLRNRCGELKARRNFMRPWCGRIRIFWRRRRLCQTGCRHEFAEMSPQKSRAAVSFQRGVQPGITITFFDWSPRRLRERCTRRADASKAGRASRSEGAQSGDLTKSLQRKSHSECNMHNCFAVARMAFRGGAS